MDSITSFCKKIEANRGSLREVPAHCPSVEDCKELIEAKEFDPEQGRWEDLRDLALLHLILADAFVLHECVGLNRSDLNRTLTCAVVGRAGGLRRVDLDSFTSAVFAEHISVCPFTIEGEAPVFVGTMGARLLARTAQLSIEKLRNRLALHEKASARSLRRAAIVRMRAEGTPDAEILRITGLKSTAHLADSTAEMPTDYRVVEEAITQARQKLAPRRTVVTAVSLTDSERRYTKPDCLNRTSLVAMNDIRVDQGQARRRPTYLPVYRETHTIKRQLRNRNPPFFSIFESARQTDRRCYQSGYCQVRSTACR
jgi:hypothetical protein